MRLFKRLSIFVVLVLALSLLMSVSICAAGEENVTGEAMSETASDANDEGLNMNYIPKSIGEAIELALQGSATGMIMVFAVLALLCVILYISKFFFYDIPRRRREEENEEKSGKKADTENTVFAPAPAAAPAPVSAPLQDDGEIAAVITAAIAAMIESGDYKNEFVGGFRVVSFKRSEKSAWNRK